MLAKKSAPSNSVKPRSERLISNPDVQIERGLRGAKCFLLLFICFIRENEANEIVQKRVIVFRNVQ